MFVRIGIDVGGTFTDAVAIDNETYELIGAVKIPTTHYALEGVAAGIIQVLKDLMQKYSIRTEDVVFIAHGTTQATNALLEGDVVKVGIITTGSGIQGAKSKTDTTIGSIPLTSKKNLVTCNEYINSTQSQQIDRHLDEAIEALKKQGVGAIVATEAFSVDNPENENRIVSRCSEAGIPATAGNDVSKLYGLKVRTRTAVINASILPKMLDSVNMTESSIKEAAITAPLMVMRCDGGVMTVAEVRNRPIMTILSGPAAGVAGALMYEKLTDGMFFEVGGTSTDISCVKDGRVVMKYAEVGGHKTYLNSLDVRTVGIGGGSMIEIKGGTIYSVGPRSAHIAGLGYEVYADPNEIVDPVLRMIIPIEQDPDYAYVECSNGKQFALTLSGAANICGYVKPEDYAYGNRDAAVKAWAPLAESMRVSVEEAAKKVLALSAEKNGAVIKGIVNELGLDLSSVIFVGGGGGASTVVPFLAETFGCKHRIAKNAEVISPIGVALAMVREVIERTVSKPTEQDLLSLRHEAIKMATKSGAMPETTEVKIEIDSRLNKIRAIVTGTTELRTKHIGAMKKSTDDLKQIVAENLHTDTEKVNYVVDNGDIFAFSCEVIEKRFGVFKKRMNSVRLIDADGVIRLQRKNAEIYFCSAGKWMAAVNRIIDEMSVFGDAGHEMPNIYIAVGQRIVDLSSMQQSSQITSLCEVELAGVAPDEKLVLIATKTVENARG